MSDITFIKYNNKHVILDSKFLVIKDDDTVNTYVEDSYVSDYVE